MYVCRALQQYPIGGGALTTCSDLIAHGTCTLLQVDALYRLAAWTFIGLCIYFGYGIWHSSIRNVTPVQVRAGTPCSSQQWMRLLTCCFVQTDNRAIYSHLEGGLYSANGRSDHRPNIMINSALHRCCVLLCPCRCRCSCKL